MAPKKIASLDIPFLNDADPRQQHDQAVEMINQKIEQEGLEVINIETIFAKGFHGLGGQQCGLRVWHRV